MRAQFRPEVEEALDEYFKLQHEAIDIFYLVVAEWESDPLSVQCFDLEMVKKASYIKARLAQCKKKIPGVF